jgi:capsular polysaccharide biosynthesis protein
MNLILIAIIVANALSATKDLMILFRKYEFHMGVYVQVNKSGFYHPVFFMQT